MKRNNIVDDWVDYLESIKDNSSNTIKSYESDVVNFLQFITYRLGLTDRSLSDLSDVEINMIDEDKLQKISVRDLIAFISYTDKHLNASASTRSRKLSSLRSFFNYLYKVTAIISDNPMNLIDGPKIPKRLPNFLALEEIKRLLNAVLETDDDFYRLRDYAIIIMFLNTGLRLSELVNIKISDIDGDEIRIIGKGNKERIVFLNDSVLEALDAYKKVRPDSDVENIFVNKKGDNFLGSRGIQYMLNKYLKKAGLSNEYSPHSLRHTAATLLYQYGDVDIRALQVILGHESVSTTQIYTHVSPKQIKEAVKLNPLNKLDLDS